jgi:hypothetical protein
LNFPCFMTKISYLSCKIIRYNHIFLKCTLVRCEETRVQSANKSDNEEDVTSDYLHPVAFLKAFNFFSDIVDDTS